MGTGFAPGTTAFTLTGSPVTVPITLAVDCGAHKASGVTVSVVGPADEHVDSGNDAPVQSTNGFTTNVTFTAATPGGYHISARFEPNLGLAQFDLVAAADRRDAGAAFVIDSSALTPCTHVEVTPAGRLVCIGDGTAQVFDGSGSTQRETGVRAEYADGVLWLVKNGTLIRRVETDAGFVDAASLSMAPPDQLLPTANDVLVVSASAASLVTASDGGLDARALTMLPISPVQWRDSNVFGSLVGNSLCLQPLDGGSIPPPCLKLGAFTPGLAPMGVDTQGIWATEMTLAGSNFVYRINPDGSSALKLPPVWLPRMRSAAWETAALVGDDGGTTLVVNGDTGLEAYARAGEIITHACTHFVVVSNGTTSRVVAR
jgi:hypothetical protein